jgi:hypothetical protein
MVPYGSRDANAARRTLGLEPNGDIYPIAVKVSTIGNYITNVHADAEANALIWQLPAVIQRDVLLHFDHATDSSIDAVECNKQRVAASLH